MNKIIFSAAAFCALANANSTLQDALVKGKASLDARIFYFDRSFDKPNTPNSKALTAGGIAKYETQEFHGAKAAIAYYGSYHLGVTDRKEGAASGLLEQTNANNLSLLGELYIEQQIGKTTLKVGRQRLSTPLANDHDLRLLPSSYEAITLKTNEIANSAVELGFINRYTGFVSKYNSFKDEEHIWGKNGLPYIYLQNTSLPGTLLRAQYIYALDSKNITVKDYRYIDASYKLPIPLNTTIKAQYGGNSFKNANDSSMYGALAEASLPSVDAALVYNKIIGNSFKAVESGAMYTDWQQGYANYEPSEALGGYLVLKPLSSLSVKVGKVWVRAIGASKKDDFTESNIDFWYTLNKNNKLRIRYSDKDQTPNTTIEDRKDFRVVYYFSLVK